MNEINTKTTAEAVFDESKENTPEIIEKPTERKRPYKLRALCAEDIFPVLTIVKKIGIKEFKECFNKEALDNVVDVFVNGAKNNGSENDNTLAAVGLSILPSVLDVVDVLLNNIPKCENDLYKFLESISDLSIEEIKKLPMSDFIGMIIDIVKKEEFKDFFKVVSELFK